MSAYTELQEKLSLLADLRGAAALLAWDQETYMAPGSASRRAAQSGSLAEIHHNIFLSEIPVLLEKAEKESGGKNPVQDLNLKQIRKDLDRAKKLPAEIVREASELAGNSLPAWSKSKKENDFATFSPWLEKILDLKLREAEFLGYTSDPYDPHLDTYEPGLKAAEFESLFEGFIPKLKALLDQVLVRPAPDDAFLNQEISKEKQLSWCLGVLDALGYDRSKGRQDLSVHPFSISMAPEDVRITTVVDEKDISAMLFSSIHETGHAIYEQGLDISQYGLPGCETCSLGMHESQSRLYENNLARSLPFWEYWFPSLSELFPDKLKGKGAVDMFRASNKVEPGLVRIYSDELTYHFHIWLRFEAERALINRKIKVKELPEFWNAKMKQYLGMDVPSDSKGCLQDIHWAHGSFGYFPTYSLGSLYAAQFFHFARKSQPGLESQFSTGNFLPLRDWLRENIHRKGKMHTSAEICTMATGENLNPDYFLTYMREKLSRVYDFQFQPAKV